MDKLEFLEMTLSYTINSTQFYDGVVVEIRKRVDNIGDLKIEIYANEHAPCHFHVKNVDINACFRIDNCELIEGKTSKENIAKVKYWYNKFNGKQKLIEAWNETRPANCPVGPYKEKV
ncbi:DUF4160 domain-containing protein [bacterium]|nr:DUF4160 domain-containing protein [bacterium]MBQ3311659.1 DUF4160 domain-containing protein [bacterium]